jgi:hypothetical protein
MWRAPTRGSTGLACTHARAHQPSCFLVVCFRQYLGVGHSLSILRQLGGPTLQGDDMLPLVQMVAPYLKVGRTSCYNIQILFSL